MPKFTCKCGNVINLSGGTTDDEWTLIPEKSIDEIGDSLSGEEVFTDENFYDAILKNGVTVYRCSVCGRLHLEERGRNKFITYVRESAD